MADEEEVLDASPFLLAEPADPPEPSAGVLVDQAGAVTTFGGAEAEG